MEEAPETDNSKPQCPLPAWKKYQNGQKMDKKWTNLSILDKKWTNQSIFSAFCTKSGQFGGNQNNTLLEKMDKSVHVEKKRNICPFSMYVHSPDGQFEKTYGSE